MSARVAICADDLTSAADGAAPFRKAGLTARISLDESSDHHSIDILAIDADSRDLEPASAARKTAAAIRSVSQVPTIVKTVDSTLRGNLATEIPAALRASGRATAIVAPAFPAQGRTTVRGVQLVSGVPVHLTAYGSDHSHPATQSELLDILPDAARWRPGTARPKGILVADARSDADLDEVVAGVADDREVVWVGSPGLAGALARRDGTRVEAAMVWFPPVTRTLAVVGSRNEISRQQLAQFVPPERICDLSSGRADEAASIVATWLHRGSAGITDESTDSTPGQVAARLAKTVVSLHDRDAFDAMLVTGGATARAVLDELQVTTLDLVGEPEPGSVAVLVQASTPFVMLLKAGGFGDPSTLRRLHEALLTHQAEREVR